MGTVSQEINAVRLTTGLDGPVRLLVVDDLSLLHNVQTGDGVHSALYPMGTWNPLLGVKTAVVES
jgi:hypothetical protein